MATKEEMLTEAYKRGLLPPEKVKAYEEATRRGLIGGGQKPAGEDAYQAFFEGQGVSADNPRRYEVLFQDEGTKGATGSFFSGVGQGLVAEHGAGLLQSISAGLRAMGLEGAADSVWSEQADQNREVDRAKFKKATSNYPTTAAAGEVAGQVAPALAVPGGVQGGMVARGLTGTAAGAGTGAVQYVDEGEFRSDNAMMGGIAGGIGGAAIAPIMGMAGRAFRKVLGKPGIRVFDESGGITDEAIEALSLAQRSGRASADQIDDVIRQQAVADGVLTPEQAQRFNLFRRYGMEPNRANLTQSTDDWRAVQEGIKRGGPVADNVATQDARMIELAQEGVERIRPLTEDVASTNANIYGVVQKVADDVDQQVSAAYRAAREQAQQGPAVQVDRLLQTIKQNTGRENITGGVVSAARQELRNRGLLKNPRLISVDEAEEIRQVFNSFFDSAKPQGRKLIRQLKDALDDDVASAVGDDVFAEARAAKRSFARIFERSKANKFDRSTGKLLEQILDGKLPENRIMSRVLSESLDNKDLVKVKGFLLEDAGEEGAQAWLNLKGQVLRDALNRATSTQAKREGGQAAFNSRLFQSSIEKLKRSGKYDLLFNGGEQAFIDDLIELGSLRVPVSSVAQGKGPSAYAVEEARDAVQQQIFRMAPFVGEKAEALVNAIRAGRVDVKQVAPTRQTEEFLRRR